ncbi:MAG: hypothetical protein AAGF74_04880 [Pseudomonadota bacterium]
MNRTIFTTLAAFAVSATAASAGSLIAVNTDIGEVIASADNGLTLYTFRKDSRDTSNCYGDCAASWPPFTAPASAQADGGLGIIERKDGSRQYALNGKPLYFWAGDSQQGDATGDGVGGVWDVVRR